MASNTTVKMPGTTKMTPDLVFSEEMAFAIIIIFHRAIFPSMGVLGIAGNVTSMVILTRRGLRKCSNILLLSLSVSNVTFLIGVNNFTQHIYSNNDPEGFQFSKSINYVCYICHLICNLAYALGVTMGPLIPILITGERIIAIFCPLKANFILTPRRTVITLLCFFLVTGLYCFYHEILCVQLKTYVINGVTTTLIVDSDMWRNHVNSGLYQLLEHILNYLTGIIALGMITVGCVIIGLKIIYITKRRQQLTSRVNASTKRGITKTTKTLLKICFLYIVCYGSAFGLAYIVENKLQQWSVIRVVVCVHNLIVCINCLGDFLIYVASNATFWTSITVFRRMKTSFWK
ncbi:unnamed protein product [Candidula unifasciata]|uniref:G-protein coupled receptors family 1 profile domain-containing protein n=1 Tax=Candidula unifasciata TaxID=100452 RepID=A0A8S3YVY7_9EUPU|nr:unnamed protein product [Candidula unifasciata]